MYKLLRIHKKLLKKQKDNLIYMSNVFQMNCLLGAHKDNHMLITSSEIKENSDFNHIVFKNFYLALNAYQQTPKADYKQYLAILNKEDLTHNPLLGYIAARCTEQNELAEKYFPLMLDYIRFMPEKNTILRVLEKEKCDQFLRLYKGICPTCEVCSKKYPI